LTIHNTNLATRLDDVAEPQLEFVRPGRTDDLAARERLADLVALGFGRVPAPLVARSLGRGRSSTYALVEPGCVGGLRAYELLLAPRPWALTVARGLLADLSPAPVCGTLSRYALVGLLAGIAGLCATAIKEDPSSLSDEALAQRQRELDQAAADLEAVRQLYEREALSRGLRRGTKARKGSR